MGRCCSCWSTCRRGCGWCWPAGPTRRCRWRGCGLAGSSLSCVPPSCASPQKRRRRCCAGRLGLACPAPRVGGWAAGLQLAGLSLRGQADAAGFVAAFTGSHRYVLDYLAEEVLERQDELVREFLLETSVLERLSGALCDAVTGRAESQAMLEQVERAGLFLVALDEVRGWWRCTGPPAPGTRRRGWLTMRCGTRWPPRIRTRRPG